MAGTIHRHALGRVFTQASDGRRPQVLTSRAVTRHESVSLTFADQDDRFGISLWVANMADEEYDVYAINLQGGFGYNYFMPGAPRTYGAEFTYRF